MREVEGKFDLIIIGTGSGGSAAAFKCNKAGWKVAIVDSQPFGGTCALRGCDPKKVLVGAAEMIDGINRMKGKGISSDSSINWPELMAYKRTFTEPVPDNRVKNFQKAGIHVFHGRASFLSEDKIQVGEDVLNGKYILIANGAKPEPLPIEGTEHLTYSDEFLELDELPAKMVFIGGGYISFEFAHIAARAGSEVHIIHRGKRPLENFEPDLVELLMEKSKEIGIHIHLNTEAKSIEKKGSSYIVNGVNNGQQIHWEGDLVLHGAGRIPDLEDMQLEKGNVEREKSGIAVNEFLQSRTNPRVYAAGDAAATEGLPLTPVASMESHVVASNLLKGNHRLPNYKVMPTVVFTLPKLASVGLSEDQAREKGHQIKVNKMETSDWYTYKRTNEKFAMVKVITDEETGKILGAHLISHEADELINHFATAIQFDLAVKDLKQMIYAYPTAASDLGYML
ncbi:NAD(P)/FAD-dependent oxidoreductase [Alkalibacterium sp. 20]|uniref:dihydrolipoyl dehydrogenase family protein n=1 Tax=Alkalibacterium sp. 20 TaxID=1798803 RepID=UPI0009003CBD|nr:NAD(P)/FAD-dependent oxidoreductase [Alkalibacterium sp. 20]OJF92215.1 pyridine nucleotide-disulfide oxidoreductase [Alkalibacterium sp. 20]